MSNAELIITAVGSPALLAVLTSIINFFVRRTEKREDWRRQDEVADRVELTRKLLVSTNQENTGLLTKLTKTTDSTHKIINNQHTILLKAYATVLERIASENPSDKNAQQAAKEAREAANSAERAQNK